MKSVIFINISTRATESGPHVLFGPVVLLWGRDVLSIFSRSTSPCSDTGIDEPFDSTLLVNTGRQVTIYLDPSEVT